MHPLNYNACFAQFRSNSSFSKVPISINEQLAPVSIVAFISLLSNLKRGIDVRFSATFGALLMKGLFSH